MANEFKVRKGLVVSGPSNLNGETTVDGNITATSFIGPLTGNADTSTTLATSRTINGTAFDGSVNITTALWGTSRTITIGSTGKSVNGSANVSWSLGEIGAAAASHTHTLAEITDSGSIAAIDTNASTSNYLRGDGTWVTPPDTNYYVSALAFVAGTLTATVSGTTNRSVSLDGRYSLLGHTHTESDITDLKNYALASHAHDTSDITTGTFANSRISQASITQHQAAFSIGWSQLTSVPTYDNYSSWNLKTDGLQRTTITSGGNLDLVAGSNVSLSYGAGGVVTISSTDTNTNTNYYLTGLSFATGTGILTATVSGAANPTVDLDGRYSLLGHTHTASNITNFDTEVSNNASVTANTAKRSYPLADENKLAGIDTAANNYTHPTYLGDDFSVDTTALTGATIVSDIDINVTTDTLGHVTDANGSVSTRTLTLADLGYTGETNATADQTITAGTNLSGGGTGNITLDVIASPSFTNVTAAGIVNAAETEATVSSKSKSFLVADSTFTNKVDIVYDETALALNFNFV